MHIRFLDIAQKELDETIEYYNHESPGLGNDFLQEVLKALNRIGLFPEAWQECSEKSRRCLTRRFPYGVIYQVRKEEILVVAVTNLHRAPDRWKGRV